MHEPDIAPLARRLAEENNVDWRRLRGTGEGGRVVERDVLGFLARVMAGDEAVDPTPEPVPEGMEAWPEEDVAAYRARAGGEPEPASPPTVDDELFLFEEPAPAARTVEEESEAEGEGLGADLEGFGDDPWFDEDLRSAAGGDEAAGDDGEEQEEEDTADAAPETTPSPAGDEAGAPSEADAESFPPPAAADEGAEPFPPPPAAAAEDDEVLLLVGDDEAEDEQVAVVGAVDEVTGATDDVRIDELPDLTAPDAPPLEAEDARVHPPGAREGFELPDLFSSDEIEVPEAPSLDALFETGAAVDGESATWEAADAAPGTGEMALEAIVDAGEAEGFEVVGAIVPDEPEQPVPDAGATPVAAEPAATLEAAEPAATLEAVEAESPREAAVTAERTEPDEAAGAAAPLAFAPDVGLVSHGQVWRRRLDDSALRRAVSDVAAVLDAAPANVTLVLLARAAHRSGVAGGPLKVWRWQRGGAELRAVDASADVRVAVRSLESPSGSGEEVPASLVVADLSALDVDEAVLHLGRPVLALGRAGRNGAWLTLSGDEVEPGSVDALVRIADLLSAPARLLV